MDSYDTPFLMSCVCYIHDNGNITKKQYVVVLIICVCLHLCFLFELAWIIAKYDIGGMVNADVQNRI